MASEATLPPPQFLHHLSFGRHQLPVYTATNMTRSFEVVHSVPSVFKHTLTIRFNTLKSGTPFGCAEYILKTQDANLITAASEALRGFNVQWTMWMNRPSLPLSTNHLVQSDFDSDKKENPSEEAPMARFAITETEIDGGQWKEADIPYLIQYSTRKPAGADSTPEPSPPAAPSPNPAPPVATAGPADAAVAEEHQDDLPPGPVPPATAGPADAVAAGEQAGDDSTFFRDTATAMAFFPTMFS